MRMGSEKWGWKNNPVVSAPAAAPLTAQKDDPIAELHYYHLRLRKYQRRRNRCAKQCADGAGEAKIVHSIRLTRGNRRAPMEPQGRY